MDVKPLLGLLGLALISSFSLSCAAIPSTPRNHISIKEDPSITNLQVQGGIGVNKNGKLMDLEGESGKANMEMEMRSERQMPDLEGGDVKGRMDLEIADYGPPSANHRHDPPPPQPHA
ncbi:Zinc finger protein JAGGED-like [Actinidia chinensis var. chinensis]|uniref:Zinc finger protein JAGGED-like n=1 Tax=Actinidia chinensis var. chinensis TaxID=1590841 RepID=A0A2R6Q482_ACTCC|nr:Zinc finger protein JAGGED-like [Actinidia chinensis var. chinensis]